MALVGVVVRVLAVFLLAAAAGWIFGDIALGATVGVVTALVLVLPLFFVGLREDTVLSLKGFLLFFRSGRG